MIKLMILVCFNNMPMIVFFSRPDSWSKDSSWRSISPTPAKIEKKADLYKDKDKERSKEKDRDSRSSRYYLLFHILF